MTGSTPFDHVVIDNFFQPEVALQLEREFPDYSDPDWVYYNNALENKKTMNLWARFPECTYKTIHRLCHTQLGGVIADAGLHGGGWHIHAAGGNLNPHLDYDIHPKLGLKRKYNLIVYLASDYTPDMGGQLGLWSGDKTAPHTLVKTIEPLFNRAVLFDTSQNSWHGMVSAFTGTLRKSIALYYLVEGEGERKRALFAPRDEQVGDKSVDQLIKRRLNGEYV